jgi:hypothetical protein
MDEAATASIAHSKIGFYGLKHKTKRLADAPVGTDPNYRGTDIFLERFEQEVTDQHRIIPGRVGSEPLERQLFMSKILHARGWPIRRCRVRDNRQSARWPSNSLSAPASVRNRSIA